MLEYPTPPGFMQTVWREDARFLSTYWRDIRGRKLYSTFDWGMRDKDGYYYLLARMDDVINVAGHRLGTREIEECLLGHASVSEAAVVGIADALKGQVAIAFVVPSEPLALAENAKVTLLESALLEWVDKQLGAVARPGRIRFVPSLPKTRSGKILRRMIQALCEGREVGDTAMIDVAATLDHIRVSLDTEAASRMR